MEGLYILSNLETPWNSHWIHLETVARERDVWNTLLFLLPSQSEPRQAKEKRQIDGWKSCICLWVIIFTHVEDITIREIVNNKQGG